MNLQWGLPTTVFETACLTNSVSSNKNNQGGKEGNRTLEGSFEPFTQLPTAFFVYASPFPWRRARKLHPERTPARYRLSRSALRLLRDHYFSGQHQTSYGGCILQGESCNFGRVNNAILKKIFVNFFIGVEPECAFFVLDLVHNYGFGVIGFTG